MFGQGLTFDHARRTGGWLSPHVSCSLFKISRHIPVSPVSTSLEVTACPLASTAGARVRSLLTSSVSPPRLKRSVREENTHRTQLLARTQCRRGWLHRQGQAQSRTEGR